MNVGHTHITLNSVQQQSQTATKSGGKAVAQSLDQSQISSLGAPNIDKQSADGSLTISRINDPLNPGQAQQTGDKKKPSQSSSLISPSSTSPSSPQVEPSSRLLAQSSQSEQQVQAQVRELAKIDREVRNHEAAHAAAGGGLTGAPSYSYTRGPDGQLYATSGEVGINTVRSADPETSIQNARTVLQAALAPANPSQQDLRVAAQARAQLIDAQAELSRNEEQEATQRPSGPSVAQPQQELAAEEEKKEDQQEKPEDNNVQRTQDELQQRQARIQQKQLEFAQEMAELNLRIQQVQQQLIETGKVDPSSLLQGSLVDTQA